MHRNSTQPRVGICSFLFEAAVLCIPLTCAVVQLTAVRLTAQPLLPLAFAMAVDLLLTPLRWGRRVWYRRLAIGEDTHGLWQYVLRHTGWAIGWRACVCLCRTAVLVTVVIPPYYALRVAEELRTLAPSPAVNAALLSCHVVATVTVAVLLPCGLYWLIGLWPLGDVAPEQGWRNAIRQAHRLVRGQREQSLLWWLRGAFWLPLCVIPIVGLYANARWQLHRARWLAQRAAALPPMRDGVKLYIPAHKNPAR